MSKPGMMARMKAAFAPVAGNVASWLYSGSNGVINEPFAQAWQRNIESAATPSILAVSSVYSCINVISSDIAKLRIRIMEDTGNGGRREVKSNPYNALLQAPNAFQTSLQFFQQWASSKLTHGNAYILKIVDNRGVPKELYVLDPTKVQALVAEDGSVFYSLSSDKLSGTKEQVIVPAREIIHDRLITLSHPLVGVSPLYAAGVSAMTGARILNNSEKFFANMSRPSGTLNTAASIQPEDQVRLRDAFEKNYSASGIGRVAVLTNGLQYTPLTVNAVDAQLIDQLKWTVTDVARVYRVPLFLIGEMSGTQYKNTEAMMSAYYQGCLQYHIESIEQSINRAFNLTGSNGAEFDLTALFRMETDLRFESYKTALNAGFMSINEVRGVEGLDKVEGGDEPRVQMQFVPLTQVNEVNAPSAPVPEEDSPEPAPEQEENKEFSLDAARMIANSFIKRISESARNDQQ